MRIARLRNFTALVRRALDFVRKNGIRITISRIQSRFKKGKKYSYTALLNEFPQRFSPPSQTTHRNKEAQSGIIDAAAQIPLAQVLSHLNINADPAHILSAFRNSFKESEYYRVLDDLFTFEKISGKKTNIHSPLIQASELPEISENPPHRRILFITSQLPSPYHGGGNRVLNFMKILSESNDVYLATSYYPGEDDSTLKEISQYCRALYKIPYWQYGNNQAEIRKWLNGTSMDIVHYEWADSLENYDTALGSYHIFTYMEAVSLRLLMDVEKLPPLSPTWLDTFAQFLHALRTEIVDTIPLSARIAVTTKDAEFLQSIHPHQGYAVLNHGVNLDDFSLPDVEPEPKTLTFVGNFGHYPNVDAMIWFFSNVWDDLLKKEPDVRIYLVGPNPPEAITRLADGRQIIVTGGVPDVRPYIQKATICIAPLISGAGLRGKVIEYAALKRTFVATSIATADLVYRDKLEYQKADTAREFADKIILLLRDGKLVEQMASAIYETTRQNYDTRRLTNFLYRLYNHLDHK